MKKVLIFLTLSIVLLMCLVACGETKHVHEFGEWSVTKNATCTEDGVKTRYCDCGEKKSETISATGHSFGEWVIVKVATETEEGKKEKSCFCGKKETALIIFYAPEGPAYVRNSDYIYFGEYPQTIKTNDVTITSTTDTRGYYLGSDENYYAKVIASPDDSNYTFSNGEKIIYGTVYYFKVEPIRWRILSEENGEALIFCDSIIASHRFDDDFHNNYAESEIRTWLNSTFYATAFSEFSRSLILTTKVDNSQQSTNPHGEKTHWNNGINQYVCENTYDKLFLLSMEEATNTAYGFLNYDDGDIAKRILTSDYSRATGAGMATAPEYYGNGLWWLRSPFFIEGAVQAFVGDGIVYSSHGGAGTLYVSATRIGVVPALRIKF